MEVSGGMEPDKQKEIYFFSVHFNLDTDAYV